MQVRSISLFVLALVSFPTAALAQTASGGPGEWARTGDAKLAKEMPLYPIQAVAADAKSTASVPQTLPASGNTASTSSMRLIAYSRQMNYSPAVLSELTHLVIEGIVTPNSNGTLSGTANFTKQSVDSQKQIGAAGVPVKVVAMIGVGTCSTWKAFSQIAQSYKPGSQKTAFAKFIAAVTTFVSQADLDGIDIDWEPDCGPVDFSNLIPQLRASLGTKILSIDVKPNPNNETGVSSAEFRSLALSVDYFNIMGYDYYSGSKIAGPNAPLCTSQDDGSVAYQNECTNAFSDYKAILSYLSLVQSPSKFNLGVPFYGRQYTKVTQNDQKCSSTCVQTSSQPTFGSIETLLGGTVWRYNFDTAAQVPYLLKSDGSAGFITYDDANSILLKSEYANATVGGTFIFTLEDDDPSYTLLNAMYAAYPKNSPVPSISSLDPSSATAGASSQTVVINGTGFLAASTVTFNGILHSAKFISSSQLTISLTSSDLLNPGPFNIVVTNPAPGGGQSNPSQFTVNSPVTGVQLLSIIVTPSSLSIATGQTQALIVYGIFSDGSTADITNSVKWSSSSTSSAAVSATGLVTGVSPGVSTISASYGTATSGAATITVTAAVLTEIDIAPAGDYIPVGGQDPLILMGTYSDQTTQTITNATWSSSDSTLASVNSNTGIVTGIANSNNNPVTIIATYGGLTNSTTMYITSAIPVSLQPTPATSSIAAGNTLQYSVNVVYSDGSIQPVTAGLSWSSSSGSVAGIDANGLATGLAQGQTTITVTYDSMSASTSLTVTAATLTNVVVTPLTTSVGINGNLQFTATGIFSDNSTQDITSEVAWKCSNGAAALINAGGLASGIGAGSATISANFGSVSGSAVLTVTNVQLVNIKIMPSYNPIVPPHWQAQLTAIGVFSDGSTAALSGVSWHTATAAYAMVDGDGFLRTDKATNQPQAIYASLNGVTGQTYVTITSMAVQSLVVEPSTAAIATGTTQPFSLIGTFSDGVTTVDLTTSARWQTSNYQNAVINRQGLASGITAGNVTIAGLFGPTSSAATLTVSAATIQSIAISPSNPSIALGSSQQFSASGSFSDGSTRDITSLVRWTSSTPTVAVVNQKGVVSSVTQGQTSIDANFNGVTGSTLLSVN